VSDKHMCTVSVQHSVPRQQICTVIWGRGFPDFFFTRVQIKPKILQGLITLLNP